jgi:hypothetical protein
MSDMLKDWTESHSDRFQKEILPFQHGLKETGLFSDEALIELLNKHPQNMLDVCTMGHADCELYPNRFRTGDFRGVDGEVLLKAAKAGQVWINVRRGMNIHPEYKTVLNQMYGGIADKTGKKAYNANGGILISSPIARVPYHFDKTETILWHVRGKKRMYLYPLTEKFIPDRAYEATMLSDLDDDLPYRSEYDEEATKIDLEEGQALSWPLNMPHRVDNQTFCVSVTTEYSTRESGMKNAAMIANATLRHRFGIESSYTNASPLNRQLKSVFGRVIRKAGFAAKNDKIDMVTFKIDPSAPNYVVNVEPYQRNF